MGGYTRLAYGTREEGAAGITCNGYHDRDALEFMDSIAGSHPLAVTHPEIIDRVAVLALGFVAQVRAWLAAGRTAEDIRRQIAGRRGWTKILDWEMSRLDVAEQIVLTDLVLAGLDKMVAS